MEIKKNTTKLGQSVSAALPMLEEVAERGLTPVCVIGMNVDDLNSGDINVWFATISNDLDPMIKELCRQMAEEHPAPSKEDGGKGEQEKK